MRTWKQLVSSNIDLKTGCTPWGDQTPSLQYTSVEDLHLSAALYQDGYTMLLSYMPF